jgi:hypothetical protein
VRVASAAPTATPSLVSPTSLSPTPSLSPANRCPYGAGTFSSQNGTITIPSYAGSVVCEYRITTGAPIYLRFDSFATEARYDYVYVYDGTSATGTLLGKFSGAAIPAIQTATSGSMLIRFTSDGSAAAAGVSMTWLDAMPATLSPTSSPTFDGIAPKCCVWMWTLLCIWSAHVRLSVLCTITHGTITHGTITHGAWCGPCLSSAHGAAAWYQFGSDGSNDCPAHSTRIVDSSACQSAAAAVGLSWHGNVSRDDYPRGCYHFDYFDADGGDLNAVYFNKKEPSGILSSFVRPLCFVGAPVSGTATL